MGGKSTLIGALLKDDTQSVSSSFDLRSWQGLTQVLKVAKESLRDPQAYAEFRDLVLHYAQQGGDPEVKKKIDSIILSFGDTPLKTSGEEMGKTPVSEEGSQTKDESAGVTPTTPSAAGGVTASTLSGRRVRPVFVPPIVDDVVKVVSEESQEATVVPKIEDVVTSKVAEVPPDEIPSEEKVTVEVREEVTVPAPQEPETFVPKTLEEYKTRITEIKRLVNDSFGNPAALMSTKDGSGKQYMSALLVALKATSAGGSGNVIEAMNDLERTFKALVPEETPSPSVSDEPAPVRSGVSEQIVPEQDEVVLTENDVVSVGPTGIDFGAVRGEIATEEYGVVPDVVVPQDRFVVSEPEPEIDMTEPAPTIPEAEVVSEPESTSVPELVSEPAPVPEPTPEPAPVPTILEAVVAPEPEHESVPISEPVHEPVAEPTPEPAPEQESGHESLRDAFQKTDDVISAVVGSVHKSKAHEDFDPLATALVSENDGYDKWDKSSSTGDDRVVPIPNGVSPKQQNTIAQEVSNTQSVLVHQQSELSAPETTALLNNLLQKWSIFSGSGLFGIGPEGIEHPLYLKLAPLSMGEVVAGRWDNADPKILRVIKQYVDAWRHEQSITYTVNETFEHYLRRVVLRIQKRQNS